MTRLDAPPWRGGGRRRPRGSEKMDVFRSTPCAIGGLARFWLVERVAAF